MDSQPSSWEAMTRAVRKLKAELWDSDEKLTTRAKSFLGSSQLRQYGELQKMMNEYRPRKTSTGQWVGIGLWTLGFTLAPLTVLARQSWFKAFCDFHVRLLRLKKRGPAGLAGMAMVMSLVYSSVALPMYIGGVCWMLGAKSTTELRATLNDTLFQKYDFDAHILEEGHTLTPEQREKLQRNKELLTYFDQVMVFGLDQSCGIEEKQTAAFLETKFARPR